MGGMISKAASSLPSGGGKSSPAPQNAYGSSYQAPAANVYQPSYQGQSAPSSGGQGFGQVMQGLQGGKSSGLGQGGYGMAPAFQQPQQQFNPFQQQFGGFQQQQFNPFQQQQFNPFQQQQFNPFQQQFGGFQQQPQNINGLQGLFNAMMNQQQMPMQRQPMQQYQDPALQYRPNMQNAQAALSRVRPSVQRQNQDAQAARIAELEAQIAAQQQQQQPSYDPWNSSGSGG
jgi:hypothetical protein